MPNDQRIQALCRDGNDGLGLFIVGCYGRSGIGKEVYDED